MNWADETVYDLREHLILFIFLIPGLFGCSLLVESLEDGGGLILIGFIRLLSLGGLVGEFKMNLPFPILTFFLFFFQESPSH